ncbi:MAG: hypothetical protein EP329_17260 [Deltaproteobacteria bacterium]|nr:MAG: hypothetical protein EP329_17260 [Deltaproteobacteria bacterium]
MRRSRGQLLLALLASTLTGAGCTDLLPIDLPEPPQAAPVANVPTFPTDDETLPDDGPVDDGILRLTAVEPDEDDVAGGSDVMLSGTGFKDGLQVVFGASPALDVFVVNHTTAVVTVPPHPAGRVDVSVWHPDVDDGNPQVLLAAFRYHADLTLSTVEPSEGDIGGGEPIVVRGSGFAPGTRFFIAGRPAIRQARVDDGMMTGLAPPGDPGPADLQIIGENGVLEAPGAYRYRQAPRVDRLLPVVGPAAGGTVVRLEGAGLDADALVRFGERDAQVVQAARDGAWLDVTTPSGDGGTTVDVTVATSWGTAVATSAWTWADDAADPLVLACATFFPQSGPEAGGGPVAIACRGLDYGVEVTFGDAPAEVLDVDSARGQLRVAAPAGTGAVPIAVTSPFATVTLPGLYRYTPAPTVAIDAVTPDFGDPAGGTAITLSGAGFEAGAQVWVGALPAGQVEVLDDTTLTAVTPPGAPGRADVVVRQSGVEARLVDGFDFIGGALDVHLVSPPTAARAGGTWLRVFGTGFDDDTTVTIGGEPCELIARVSSAELDVRSPKLEVGTYDVRVAGGGREALLTAAFTVFDPRSGYGGTWGAPIDDTLNVTVWGTSGYGPVAGAFVIVGPDGEPAYTGYTDENGQLTFSTPGFRGPVELTASKQGFTSYSVVHFDATNVTVYLRQDPVPATPSDGGGTGSTGPPPNAVLRGKVLGLDKYVVAPPGECAAVTIDGTQHCVACDPEVGCVEGGGFACVDLGLQGSYCAASCSVNEDCPAGYSCGATSSGARCIPSPGERIAYCNVTTTSLFGYEYPIQETAWVSPGETYELDSRRLGDLAIYCFGGYRTDNGVFTPTAFGVKRHVFAISAAEQEGLDVELTHPLKRTFRLQLQDPPTWPTGVRSPQIIISLDLGADGVVPFSRTYLDAGDDVWLAPHQLAALSGTVYDASYFFYTTLQADVSGPYPRSYNLVQYVTKVVEDRLPVYEDGAWRLEGTQLERDLNAAWGTPEGYAYAVGEDGLIMLLSNGSWTEQTSRTEWTLRAVDGRDGQDVWAVGDRGTVRHWDGLAWHPIDAPLDDYQAVVAVPGSDEVFAAGTVRVRRWSGGTWTVAGPPALQAIRGLDALADGRVAAVGTVGRAFTRDLAGVWSAIPVTGGTEATLRAVYVDPSDGRWTVVGDAGTVLEGDANGLTAVPVETSADLTALTPTADGGLIVVGDDGAVLWRDSDGWRTDTIPDYRSRALGVIAPPDGGPVRVVGSAAFILGPFLHFPIITAPVHDASLTDTVFAWTWTGGPASQFSRLILYPEAGSSIWELVVDGTVTSVTLPDIRSAAGFDAMGTGRRRLEVTRILHPDFDIDGYTTRDFSIYMRDSWSVNQTTFYAP